MPTDTQEILDFIQHFEDCQDTFTNDGGYWFAAILSQRFPGTICFDTEKSEFVARIDYRFYNITGECTNLHKLSDIQTWEHMQQTSKPMAKHITDTHILFKDEPDTNPAVNELASEFGVIPGENPNENYILMGRASHVSGQAYKPFGRRCVGVYVIQAVTDELIPTGEIKIAVWREPDSYLRMRFPDGIIDIPEPENKEAT